MATLLYWVLLFLVIIGEALIGAGINAAAYTASVAFSNGGFSNWNWGQFGSAVGRGALSGAATAGIGQAFGSVGSIGKELGRASAHALSSGGISRLGGGDFWSGAAAGGLGSATGSATHNFKPHWQIAGSALSGGLGAELGGGDFLQGAAMGGIIAGANHLVHRDPYRRIKRIARKSGAKYFTDKKEFYDYLWENSFNENGEAIREVSGWELKNGHAIALPYDKNHFTPEGGAVSYNDALPVDGKVGNRLLKFEGKAFNIDTHAHTHPMSHRGFHKGDIPMVKFVGRPIHILWNKQLYAFRNPSDWVNLGPWK